MNEDIRLAFVATPLPHLPDLSRYTLTIGEASTIMQLESCKFSSARKVQRLCRDGFVDCHKLQTTRNGQPVSEWLISEASLRRRIEEHEPRLENGVANLPTNLSDDATKIAGQIENQRNRLDAVAMPDQIGDAISDAIDANITENQSDDVTTPDEAGIANLDEPNKASLMIENARLTAELDGSKQLVERILDDHGFLREELRDAREGRKDVTKIAERMLEALETMALGGKLQRLSRQEQSVANPIPQQPQQPPGGDIQTDDLKSFRI